MKNNNETIICLSVILTTLFIAFYILFSSDYNGVITLRYAFNPSTGEQFSLFISIFLYLLLWGFILGLLSSAALCVIVVESICFLLFVVQNHFPSGFDKGLKVSFLCGYISTFVLMLLHISGLFTVQVF